MFGCSHIAHRQSSQNSAEVLMHMSASLSSPSSTHCPERESKMCVCAQPLGVDLQSDGHVLPLQGNAEVVHISSAQWNVIPESVHMIRPIYTLPFLPLACVAPTPCPPPVGTTAKSQKLAETTPTVVRTRRGPQSAVRVVRYTVRGRCAVFWALPFLLVQATAPNIPLVLFLSTALAP